MPIVLITSSLVRGEARKLEIDVTQGAEGEREHHVVGDDVAERTRDFEGQRDRTAGIGAYRDEHVTMLDGFGRQLPIMPETSWSLPPMMW